jgi:amino acid transporter
MLKHLFTQDFLIAPSFAGLSSISDKTFTTLAILLVAFGVFFSVLIRRTKNPVKKDLYSRWSRLSYTISLLAIIWVFFRYEEIPQISAHWIILLIYLIGLIWAVNIIRYVLNAYKPRLDAYNKDQMKKKYM